QPLLDRVGQGFLRRLGIGRDAPLALVREGCAAVLLQLAALVVLHEPKLDADGVPDFVADDLALVVADLAALVEAFLGNSPAPANANRPKHLCGALDHVMAADAGDLLAVYFRGLGGLRGGLLDLAPDTHVVGFHDLNLGSNSQGGNEAAPEKKKDREFAAELAEGHRLSSFEHSSSARPQRDSSKWPKWHSGRGISIASA